MKEFLKFKILKKSSRIHFLIRNWIDIEMNEAKQNRAKSPSLFHFNSQAPISLPSIVYIHDRVTYIYWNKSRQRTKAWSNSSC